MSWNTVETSLENARQRLRAAATRATARRRRADAADLRIDPAVRAELETRLLGLERPPLTDVLAEVGRLCRAQGRPVPSRATLYRVMAAAPGPTFRVRDLPAVVQEALFNLEPESRVPGHQVAFHCLNYGGTRAIGYAAALPWLCLYQAAQRPGWRPRSRGLLEAIRRVRGI